MRLGGDWHLPDAVDPTPGPAEQWERSWNHELVNRLLADGKLKETPILDHVAAISVGIVQGTPLLDLDYAEDSACDTDMNVVMTGAGNYVEVQGTAEGAAFSRKEMDALLVLAEKGIAELVGLQKNSLSN